MARSRTVLALCDPEPFTVATWMLKSLTTGPRTAPWSAPCTANSVVAINTPYQRWMSAVGEQFNYKAVRKAAGTWTSRSFTGGAVLRRRTFRPKELRHVPKLLIARVQQGGCRHF